jgi:hypothetical protein
MQVFGGVFFKYGCFITVPKKNPTDEIEATGRTLVILANSLRYWPKGVFY